MPTITLTGKKSAVVPPDLSDFIDNYGKDFFRLLVINTAPERGLIIKRAPRVTYLLLGYNQMALSHYEGFAIYVNARENGARSDICVLEDIVLEIKNHGAYYGTVEFKEDKSSENGLEKSKNELEDSAQKILSGNK